MASAAINVIAPRVHAPAYSYVAALAAAQAGGKIAAQAEERTSSDYHRDMPGVPIHFVLAAVE